MRHTHVTESELNALQERAADLSADLVTIETRLQRTVMDGSCATPIEKAATFFRAARILQDIALHLLHRPAMDELRTETEAELRKRST